MNVMGKLHAALACAHSSADAISGIFMTRFSAMLPDFDATVRAIADTVADREQRPVGTSRLASAFVLASFAGLPAYLRPPLRAATLVFDAWPMIRQRAYFHDLPPEKRQRLMEAWECSFLGPARMLMTFYVSLSLFGLWSDDLRHG